MGQLEQLSAAIGKVVSELAEHLPGSVLGAVQPSPARGDEPLEVMTPRAFVIVYDPVMDHATGERLTQRMGWDKVEAFDRAGDTCTARKCRCGGRV